MAQHPELAAEQTYVDHAYACLQRARDEAGRLRELTSSGPGGTHQNRYEREVIDDLVVSRLARLDLDEDHALVFGRIDTAGDGGPGEAYHIGRVAVSDEHGEPVVVDWRAPVAEPFYRATGRHPMGLVRRRHFSVRGRHLFDLEDEVFADGRALDGQFPDGLRGHSTLLAAIERSRTGRLSDIVATIQGEQDDIIRADPAGVLVVQGGPGTGKTVVALHRAAYLLYTYRFPLEGQGVLVIGPNRLFLRYIERVLPSLGEAGVEQVVLADLVPDVAVSGADRPLTARVKGDARMVQVLAKAVRDRERPLTADLVVGLGLERLRLRVDDSARIVAQARRRYRRHNAGRRFVDQQVFEALAASSRNDLDPLAVRDQLRGVPEVRAALERMWPVLTPAELLHDLFGSAALVRLAASRVLTDDEWAALVRPRCAGVAEVAWTDADLPLLDEARVLLGPRPSKAAKPGDDELRTYGHIVVDEVQDLTPMALRMVARRSLGGNLTVVGDIAQATGPLAPRSWADVLAHLPDRRQARVRELTVGYRIPSQAMALAGRLLRVIEPGLAPPRSVRDGEYPPVIVRADPWGLDDAVVGQVEAALAAVVDGSVAVVCPASLTDSLAEACERAGLTVGRATRTGLDAQVTVVPVALVKGLELDAVVVAEPARIAGEEHQGLRALYVALTRATKYLALVHSEALPDALAE